MFKLQVILVIITLYSESDIFKKLIYYITLLTLANQINCRIQIIALQFAICEVNSSYCDYKVANHIFSQVKLNLSLLNFYCGVTCK